MQTAQVIQFRAPAKPVSEACRWSEAFEAASARNLQLWFAWQRMVLRSWLL